MADQAQHEVKKMTSRSSDVEQPPTDFLLARALSPEERIATEKKLKLKLDLRCSLFVLIYILSESTADARSGPV
jgi:hypothetical protein